MDDIQILLVEDNPGDVYLTRATFEESGLACNVQVLDDGEFVMDLLNKGDAFAGQAHPDFIIMDINMPLRNGLEALQMLKADQNTAQVPVFMLTSSSMGAEIDKAKELGANGFIVKGSHFALQTLIDYASMARHKTDLWVHVCAEAPSAVRV